MSTIPPSQPMSTIPPSRPFMEEVGDGAAVAPHRGQKVTGPGKNFKIKVVIEIKEENPIQLRSWKKKSIRGKSSWTQN